MPSRARTSAATLRVAVALVLALLVAGCGSGVETRIGSPQSINSTLPKAPKHSGTDFPEIGTRFVLPHLTPTQKHFVRAYIDWSVATLGSMRSGRLDPRIKKLSSAKTFANVRKQVAQAAASRAGTWKRIVQRIGQVVTMGTASAFGVCMSIATDAGAKSKVSLLVQMAERSNGWYVYGFAVSPSKLPNC